MIKRIICWIRKLTANREGQDFFESWGRMGHRWEAKAKILSDHSRLSYCQCSVCGCFDIGSRYYPITPFGRPRLEYPSGKIIKAILKMEEISKCD